MRYVKCFLVAALLLTMLTVPASVKANGHIEDCYFISTQDTLVRVLTGARHSGEGLVAGLTSGERWVLKTFFRLEAELLEGTAALQCGPSVS